jgi:hypothetical protein
VQVLQRQEDFSGVELGQSLLELLHLAQQVEKLALSSESLTPWSRSTMRKRRVDVWKA